jgi:uncharacterized protein (DUF2461 family)
VHGKAFRERYEFWGEALSKPPRGIDPAHELIEDLKRKNQAAGIELTDAVVCSTDLKPVLVDHMKRLAPLLDYLCAALDLEF